MSFTCVRWITKVGTVSVLPDHLVIGAASLEQGAAYVQERLGLAVSGGGEHPLMGTHNRLLKLGEGVFLEVIAVNPDAPAPERPRWFGLDDPCVRESLARRPRLLGWVVRTPNIAQVQAKTSFSFGEAVPVNRGTLSWHFGLPDDGRLLASGMLPYFLTWSTSEHPAEQLANSGCTLERLEIFHPYTTWLTQNLKAIGAADLVKLTPLEDDTAPCLRAHIRTPTGLKTLD